MKKIFNQLCKLYKEGYITLSQELLRYSYQNPKVRYRVYIAEPYGKGHTPEFETLKELDTYLYETIEDYKKVYR